MTELDPPTPHPDADDPDGTPVSARQPEVVVVSGMSGAGRTTVAKVMEDHGWSVIDNLPISLLDSLLNLADDFTARTVDGVSFEGPSRVGIVVDIRVHGFELVADALRRARQMGWRTHFLFLEATDEALVRRFESVRRPHPLQGVGRLLDGITRERALVADIRAVADQVIDTSGLNVHQLARKVTPIVADDSHHRVRVAVMSFGFKYGVPLDADFVFDMRFLPNPFWVPELRAQSGREPAVAEFVMSQSGATEFVDRVVDVFVPVTAGYVRENRRYVTVAVGCTGGKHRSVAVAEALSHRLASDDVSTFVVHRDLGRE